MLIILLKLDYKRSSLATWQDQGKPGLLEEMEWEAEEEEESQA